MNLNLKPVASSAVTHMREFFFRNKRVLLAAVIFFVATASFLWPMITHLGTYSNGGDHMFNAWTLARDHHCILHQACPHYSDANIFFPHKDSMLYSETQLSAGLLTLPFFLINQNPLFSANIWYFLSVFFAGFFMYLLARYLSRGNEPVSILAGLVFEFAPTKITSVDHLQNLSFFYVPLIILLLLKYRDTGSKKYLVGFGGACALLFLASWYQMVLGLAVIGLFIIYVFVADSAIWRRGLWLTAAVLLAVLITLPLAKEYMSFSKTSQATFPIKDQITYSSSLDDYFLPYDKTVFGSLYYRLKPYTAHNSHNFDSYSYAGMSLYIVAALYVITTFRKKGSGHRERKKFALLLTAILLVGLAVSLGPVIKLGNSPTYHVQSLNVVVAGPYIFVDRFLPQLSFMRAVGRASELVLFALCCFLALSAIRLAGIKPPRKRHILTALLITIVALDLLPFRIITEPFRSVPAYETSFSVPAVYRYIKARPNINNLAIIRTQTDYPNVELPTATAEDVLWSGYHNRNIFNGYSGYYPPGYYSSLKIFRNLQPSAVERMKSLGLRYVLLDKQLSGNRPDIESKMDGLFSKKVYEDKRYALFRI